MFFITSKSSKGGPLSDSIEAFKRLWRLHVAKKVISWSLLYLVDGIKKSYKHYWHVKNLVKVCISMYAFENIQVQYGFRNYIIKDLSTKHLFVVQEQEVLFHDKSILQFQYCGDKSG